MVRFTQTRKKKNVYVKKPSHTNRKTYKNTSVLSKQLCTSAMSFQDCELAILRHAVDINEKKRGEEIAQTPEIMNMFGVVEDFIRKHKLICYGGTAINNILPKYDQFYNKEVDIPDYDFFSTEALKHAKMLADIYYQKGYTEVEAKAGVHKGTYKVFVNFIPVADITDLHEVLFRSISKEAIVREGIRYAPPNYLRMNMYLELSRPQGDVSRWEKVLKRMNLLNKHYPIAKPKQCTDFSFQRPMEKNKTEMESITQTVRNVFVKEGCVFFGAYASSLYASYNTNQIIENIPDFDVLVKEPKRVSLLVKEALEKEGYKNIKIFRHTAMGEIIPEHYELLMGVDTLAFLYYPISCHSYNTITIQGLKVNIATIDTMLSLYLAFLYANKPYFNETRILCLAELLFQIQRGNRLKQSGLLKRFTFQCYGEQETLEKMRAKKTKMFTKLKKGSAAYDEWFLKYNPALEPKNQRKRKPKPASLTTASNEKYMGENISYEIIEEDTPTAHSQKLDGVSKQSAEIVKRKEDDTSDVEDTDKSYMDLFHKPRNILNVNRRREGFLY